MRLRVEFTTEPFQGEGEPPAHVTATVAALGAATLESDVGPFGTSAAGEGNAVCQAVAAVLEAAFAQGATRVTVQVERADE